MWQLTLIQGLNVHEQYVIRYALDFLIMSQKRMWLHQHHHLDGEEAEGEPGEEGGEEREVGGEEDRTGDMELGEQHSRRQ